MTSMPAGATSGTTDGLTNVDAGAAKGAWTQGPLHFDLGVDVLASRAEMGALPHDWDPGQLQHRHHGAAQWPPASPAQLEVLAATMDVRGF